MSESARPTSGTRWTEDQLRAIRTQGCSILVSAAAGSGKTSVLAERCAYLVCERPRCGVNQLLVVTFTDAAAMEMRSRIEQALRRRLSDSRDDAHLLRQFALIEHIQCSTIHSFCSTLLRENFHRLGIDPAFRVLDGDEAALLQHEIVRGLFAERYDGPDSERFRAFIDCFGDGRDDDLMQEVLSTYDLLRSVVDPNAWMSRALKRIQDGGRQPLERSEFGREYIGRMHQRLSDLHRDCAANIQALERLGGFRGYIVYLQSLMGIVESWKATLDRSGYDALVQAVADVHLPRLPSVPEATPGKEAAKGLVSAIQDQFRKGPLCEGLSFTSSQWREGLLSTEPHAQVFLRLIKDFSRAYRQEKDAIRAMDFADLERLTLKLLSESVPAGSAQKLWPSPVARALHKQYQHVLVDEYQDINEVQDAILTLVSRECLLSDSRSAAEMGLNLFCVGDVKQSIYRFRLAEPARFLDRYATFKRDSSRGCVIDLQANFRSRAPLLDALNCIFERIIRADSAEIEYDSSHRLNAMAEFPPADDGGAAFSGKPVELHLLPDHIDAVEDEADDVELERAGREALLIAQRIRDLMGLDGGRRRLVADRNPDGGRILRPIEYRDIVILLRATRYHADEYADVLRQQGIPVYNTGGGGYFDAMEVRDVLSLLRVLDNQQQDVPLAAVLRSPISGLPEAEDALARIRLAYPVGAREPSSPVIPFHQAVTRYAAEKDDELAARLRDFLIDLRRWREMVRHRPVAELLWTIYEETGYLAFCSGLENGQRRCANLVHLYERARQFGTFSRQGLYRFIRFLEGLSAETDLPQACELNEAENLVRIMSIHKAKGLEFPVVILPGLGKRINFGGCSGRIVVDRKAGLGMEATDLRRFIRYPSLASTLVSERLKRQTIAEELRILYVAMTRAKEHLICVGTCGSESLEKWKSTWRGHAGPLPSNTILNARTMLDWIGPVAAILSSDDDNSVQIQDHSAPQVQQWMASLGRERSAPRITPELAQLQPLRQAPAPDPAARQVIERLTAGYPFSDLADLQASTSVTALAKSGSPAWNASKQEMDIDRLLPRPRFLRESEPESAADRGTAAHLFLEHLDFSRPASALEDQLAALVERKLMTAAQADAVDRSAIQWFLESDLGGAIRSRAATIRREVPVNTPIAPEAATARISNDPRDQVMLRGRVDLLFEDDGGLVLVDYKTDQIDESLVAQRCAVYRPQIEQYRAALERFTGRTIVAAYLVFLAPRIIQKV